MDNLVEGIEIPENVEQLKKLAKDSTIYVLFNAHGIIQRYMKEPVDYKTCWRLKPLSWRLETAIERGYDLYHILSNLNLGVERLVKIP